MRADAEWHHRVTGASVKRNPLWIGADEIERLRGLLRECRQQYTFSTNRELGERIDAALGATVQPSELPPDTATVTCKHGVVIHTRRHCQACEDEPVAADKSAAITDPNATRRGIAD
jgi:hypothetical protein